MPVSNSFQFDLDPGFGRRNPFDEMDIDHPIIVYPQGIENRVLVRDRQYSRLVLINARQGELGDLLNLPAALKPAEEGSESPEDVAAGLRRQAAIRE